MKRLFTTAWVVLFVWFATTTSAYAGIFKWGIEAGANFSKMKLSKDIIESNNRAGWFAGLKGQVTLPIVGLAADGAVLYSQKYMSLSETVYETGNGDVVNSWEQSKTKTMPYFEIPVNVKYNIGLSSVIGAYISTGPQWSWYMGSKSISLGEMPIGSLKESNFSWNVGVGINALKHLQLGVTYNIPLGNTGDVSKGSFTEVARNIELKNNTWQVRLAYMF